MRIVETYDIENFGKVAKVYAKLNDIVYLGRDNRYKVSCDICCFKPINVHIKNYSKRFCNMCTCYMKERDIESLNSMETIYFIRLTATNKNKL